MSEISNYNVLVKHSSFPKEAFSVLRVALESIVALALSLHMNYSMAFSAYSLLVLFPRDLLRPLPNGCQGRFGDGVLRKRCELFNAGDIMRLITDSRDV